MSAGRWTPPFLSPGLFSMMNRRTPGVLRHACLAIALLGMPCLAHAEAGPEPYYAEIAERFAAGFPREHGPIADVPGRWKRSR